MNTKGHNIKKGFTLVELIIVITILAILATIAFISFQGYSKNARDGNRLTTMKNISKGLEVYQVQTGNYPKPDNSFNVEASGTLIGYQGIIGDSLSKLINISKTPTDPFDNSNYLYSISPDNKKYQLLGYLETTDYLSLLNQSYAIDYSNRYIKTIGDKVGVILDTDKAPINGVTKVEVATGSTIYNVYFGDNDVVNGSGNIIFSNIYNRRVDLTNNKNLASLDDSLVGYWDMETTSGGKLKDLSRYGNDGICYNTGIIVSCGQTGLGPQIINGDGKSGKSMNFDGEDDVIMIPKNDYSFNNLTFVVKLKHSGAQEANNGGGWRILSSQVTDHFFLRINDSYRLDGITPLVRGNLVFSMSVSGVSGGSTIGNQLIDGKYHTIINTKSNKIRNYIDGNLMNEYDNIVGILNTGDYLWIGGASLIGELFSGIIDEVRIYNRALSISEVQEIYNSIK